MCARTHPCVYAVIDEYAKTPHVPSHKCMRNHRCMSPTHQDVRPTIGMLTSSCAPCPMCSTSWSRKEDHTRLTRGPASGANALQAQPWQLALAALERRKQCITCSMKAWHDTLYATHSMPHKCPGRVVKPWHRRDSSRRMKLPFGLRGTQPTSTMGTQPTAHGATVHVCRILPPLPSHLNWNTFNSRRRV